MKLGFDWGQNNLDVAVREIGREFWDNAVALSDQFVQEVIKLSRQTGVDPGYVFFTLDDNIRTAKRLAGQNGRALELAWRLKTARGRPTGYERYTIPAPDEEYLVDKAIQRAAQWAATDFKRVLAKSLVGSIQSHNRQIEQGIREMGAKADPMKAVIHELPLRINDHPFWFQSPTALHEIVVWLFGR